jgi:hypothetical protein
MLRGIWLPLFGILLALLGPSALDRVMKDAVPEAVLRYVATGVVGISLLYGLLSENPINSWLRHFRTNQLASTITIAGAAAIFSAAVWVFLVIGFPSSKDYVDFRVRGWIKSLKAPWTVTEAPDPRAYFGFYIDHADELGVGAFRPKDPENDHYVIFDADLDLIGNRRLLFDRLSNQQNDKFFRELGIEADKQKIRYVPTRSPPSIAVRKLINLTGTLTAESFEDKLEEVHRELHLLAWTIDKFLAEAQSESTQVGAVQQYPRLWGFFSGALDNEGGNGVTNVFPLLTITNNGPPTIVDIGTATIKCGQKSFTGLRDIIYEEGTQHVFQTGVETIKRSDMIVEKLGQNEIRSGGRVTGWLMYELPGISLSELRSNRYEISIPLRDASGNVYVVSTPTADQMGGEPGYVPGFDNPILRHVGEPPVTKKPTPPSPTPNKEASPR